MERDAEEFVDQLLEVNSARVQSGVTERVRESRRKLEAEIKAVLQGAVNAAEFALARAREAQSIGAAAVQASLAHLDEVEAEIPKIVDRQAAEANCGQSSLRSNQTVEPR